MRTKKALTPEQLAAAAARKEKFKALAARVAAMKPEEREALASRVGVVTVEAHALSVKNSCLVWMQSPSASVVGGFGQWKKYGRQVRKGESGLMILVPVGFGKKNAATGEYEPADDDGKRGFIPGYVFDVSQTEPLTSQAE
jgi:hypothetical protein